MTARHLWATDRADRIQLGSLLSEIIIVGAGYSGSVVAERLASAGHSVRILERREHIAGNAYDYHDDNGVLVHRYGPHIFHTNSDEVFDYLSRFTGWRDYEHRVLAQAKGQLLPIPINPSTHFVGPTSTTCSSSQQLWKQRQAPRRNDSS